MTFVELLHSLMPIRIDEHVWAELIGPAWEADTALEEMRAELAELQATIVLSQARSMALAAQIERAEREQDALFVAVRGAVMGVTIAAKNREHAGRPEAPPVRS
jgi:septal ring factor EnvC (AmiA/AmiB activator)